MSFDTVVALSTPPGESGIAVVRMSGGDAEEILERMVPGAREWESHKIYRADLSSAEGEPIDEVLAVIMRAPNSYTGEDVVEISCHGSMHVAFEIIEEALRLGAREAGAGEFTRRAYLSGKIDLSQAEAVADLISSETKLQSRVALEHLKGGLSRRVREIEGVLLEQLALVEVSIDFSQEDIEVFDRGRLEASCARALDEIGDLIESEHAGKKLRQGIRITILGPRNAGKSSLYNALLGEERAIVSPVPGTTRDLIRERIHIGGFTYHLEDTAGIADTSCEIEAMGISIGREAAKGADLVLFVIDGSVEWNSGTDAELGLIRDLNHVVVINKGDLKGPLTSEELAGRHRLGIYTTVSAVSGEGLEELKKAIYESTVKREISGIRRERLAVNARQGAALRDARAAVERARGELAGEAAAEILGLELREALDACGRVTGRSAAPDLLDVIFGRFCIGK